MSQKREKFDSQYPDLDDTMRYDDTEGDRLQGLIEKWAAYVKDGEDLEDHYLFDAPRQMELEEVNFIKITYEASLEKEPVGLALRKKVKEAETGIDTEEKGKMKSF